MATESRHNYKVGQNGEIYIRKELMEALGIGPDWIVLQRVVDNKLEVEFLPPEHSDSLGGIAARYVTEETKFSDDEWHRIKEKAWTHRAEQKMRLREMEI